MINLRNVFILGDSYSTFGGFNPKGNNVWYYEGGHERTDVTKAEETWWNQLLKETESNLILNESFSGSTVCNTERENIPHTSFVYRLNGLIEKGFFEKNKIDTFFIFGGTNDSWIDSPIGEKKYSDFTEEDLKNVLPAFCYVISTLKNIIPNTKLIAVLNCDIKEEIISGFKEISEYFKITVIPLKEVEKQNGHPNKAGMMQIKNQILNALKN